MTHSPANRVVIPRTPPARGAPRRSALLRLDGETMGTTWSLQAWAPWDFPARRFAAEIRSALDRVIRQMSPWEPLSDLQRFNALAPGKSLLLAPEFREVLACALAVAEETDGAFDPSLGALVDHRGFGPAATPASAALCAGRWRELRIEDDRIVQPGAVALDLCGIAKGFAVDLLARTARQAGLDSFLIEIGGELRGAGMKPDGQPWWVEIEAPPGCDAPPLVAALCDLSVATSGDYHRFDIVDGVRLSHTIDPATARPTAMNVAAVSVFHRSCMRADACATALAVMGADAGLAHAARSRLAARFIVRTPEGLVERISPVLAAMMDD